jgi:hypothetical protein
MGSQALGSRADAASSTAPSTQTRTGGWRRRPGPNLKLTAVLLVGAWVVPILTTLTRIDPLLVVLIVFGTGGLLRVGSTVVDRLMITLALLIGLALVGGLLFSLWPWGLQPIALGGLALSLLVLAYAWTGSPPPWRTWPRRMLGSDLILAFGLMFGTLLAYWPSFGFGTSGVDLGNKLGYAGLTGDRLRHFSLFDTIHRLGGYTFLMQGKAKPMVDPGVLAIYPPGQHYIYALGDIFLRSNMNPGNPVSEMMRYNVWVSLGYGFFIVAVAWSARWVAGPYLAGWRRSLLVGTVTLFLATGAFTSAIWCTWDPQVFSMGMLAMMAALCFRPPTNPRLHIVLMALGFITICLSYELFAIFGGILILASLATYRRRLLPHWKLLVAVAIVGAPAAFSEYYAAHRAGLKGGSAAAATGFTIPLSWLVFTLLGVACVGGFATVAARRRPSAVAGLLAVLLGGLAVVAMIYEERGQGPIVDLYYVMKFDQAWAIIMLVAAGTFGHLLRRPALPRTGFSGALAGVGAFVVAIALTHGYWWAPQITRPAEPASDPNPGAAWALSASSNWAGIWMGRNIVPANIKPLEELNKMHMLADGVPTVVVIFPDAGSNVNFTLQLATLNQDAGTMGPVVYGYGANAANLGLNAANGLTCAGVGPDGQSVPFTATQQQNLAGLEAGIAAVGKPVRVIVLTQQLDTALTQWGDAHPGAISDVLHEPQLTGAPQC